MTSVSERIATALAGYATDVFGVIGNGNIHFLDAVEASEMTFTAVRHEAGAVAAADAYGRVSGRVGIATTTYGPGFTNTITSLAEASQARIPLLLVTGDAPSTGARPWDVDQAGISAGVDVPTFVVDAHHPGETTLAAFERAVHEQRPVVLAIPYDLAHTRAEDEALRTPVLSPRRPQPATEDLARVESLLNDAARPLLLAGRGARLADAGPAIEKLGDRLGALSASTVAARNLLRDDGHLGIAGGFATAAAAELMAEADVVLVFGAGLNQFTTRSGQLFASDATVIQIDVTEQATNARVDHHIHADARAVAEQLGKHLDLTAHPSWREAESERVRRAGTRDAGDTLAPDGRLDPRSLSIALNGIIPSSRTVVQDGGHFLGWAPMYWDIPGPHALNTVGTAYQAIGLGLPSAVGAERAAAESTTVLTAGDGGTLMALPDLDTVIRTARSTVVVVFNDAAYGAEIHQHGDSGLASGPMMIPEVDFASVAAGLGARSSRVHTLDDLQALRDWVSEGATGTFVLDCRVSRQIAAPYMVEHAGSVSE